jgi:hypothetical protein
VTNIFHTIWQKFTDIHYRHSNCPTHHWGRWVTDQVFLLLGTPDRVSSPLKFSLNLFYHFLFKLSTTFCFLRCFKILLHSLLTVNRFFIFLSPTIFLNKKPNRFFFALLGFFKIVLHGTLSMTQQSVSGLIIMWQYGCPHGFINHFTKFWCASNTHFTIPMPIHIGNFKKPTIFFCFSVKYFITIFWSCQLLSRYLSSWDKLKSWLYLTQVVSISQ